MKLLMENWRKFINEQIITFDFDNTLRMKSDKSPNGTIINKVKELAGPDVKIYIVSTRKEEKRPEVEEFVKKYNLPVDGIYLTNWDDKWYTLQDLGCDMHFDDDQREWGTIEQNLPNIKLIKVDDETGEIVTDLEEIIKKSGDEYCLKSKKGKNLGCYPSKSGAEKREKQVRYFKHKDK